MKIKSVTNCTNADAGLTKLTTGRNGDAGLTQLTTGRMPMLD